MDLAFCSYHENSQNHWIPFLEDEIWAVVPDGHPLAGCEELSLAQLAALCEPPVTKSSLSHRLRKLIQLSAQDTAP